MYADIDKDGKVSLHDMDPAEAELIQTAAIRLAEETLSLIHISEPTRP